MRIQLRYFNNIFILCTCFILFSSCSKKDSEGGNLPHSLSGTGLKPIPDSTNSTTSPIGIAVFRDFQELYSHDVILSEGSTTQPATKHPVRINILWDKVEKTPGIYRWDDNEQIKLTEKDPNVELFPVIRLKSKRYFMCGESPTTSCKKLHPTCGVAPEDLVRLSKIQEGEIYSRSFYNFIKAFALNYKSQFKSVVIENEMNDTKFFCPRISSSPNFYLSASLDEEEMSDYLRILITAKTALLDAKSTIKLSDGGIQGHTLDWLIIDKLIKTNQGQKALTFYQLSRPRKFSG